MFGAGFLKGLAVTFKTMFKKPATVQYPHEKVERAPRTRGVIALKEENCTVCMLCARECPVWCIFIEGYKDQGPPRRPGGKPRLAQKLDRFDIDYSLCMYCSICVDVCPFDALFWSPEAEYSEPRIASLLHDKTKLGLWMESVPEKPALEEGAEVKEKRARVSTAKKVSAAPEAATQPEASKQDASTPDAAPETPKMETPPPAEDATGATNKTNKTQTELPKPETKSETSEPPESFQ